MTDRSNTISLAVTMGDPAGIGPDVIRRYVNRKGPGEDCSLVIAGDGRLLMDGFTQETIDRHRIRSVGSIPDSSPSEGGILVWDASDTRIDPDTRGTPSTDSGSAAMDYVRSGYRLVNEGLVDGIVTGPVSKEVIAGSEQLFKGHTEWFAVRQGVKQPVMGIKNGDWIVTTVTRHVPIRKLPLTLTDERITETVETLHGDLKRYFGMDSPRIGVSGLNPHAGERGRIGSEEIDLIEPVVRELKANDINVEGPSSAETLLTEDGFDRLDAVVVMFHDQAFVPLKARGLDGCASFTLGLDMVRTSVAHGTGYGLVGTDQFSDGSFRNAVELAAAMARRDKAS